MEIKDDIEVRLITLSRKIRKVNSLLIELRNAGAKTSLLESIRVREELLDELKKVIAELEQNGAIAA